MIPLRASAGAMLAIALVACASVPAPPSASSPTATGVPQVSILQPESGATLALDERVELLVVGTDSIGIDRLDLTYDDTLVDSATSPPGAGQRELRALLEWVPRTAGPAVLAVTAYRTDGTASAPSLLPVSVIDEGVPISAPPTEELLVREVPALASQASVLTVDRAWVWYDPATQRVAAIVELRNKTDDWVKGCVVPKLAIAVDKGSKPLDTLHEGVAQCSAAFVPPGDAQYAFEIATGVAVSEYEVVAGVALFDVNDEVLRSKPKANDFSDVEWRRQPDGTVIVTGRITSSGAMLPVVSGVLIDSGGLPLGIVAGGLACCGAERVEEPFELTGDVLPGEIAQVELASP